MKIKLKTAVWFMTVALILDLFGAFSLFQIKSISEPLAKDIPKGIEELVASAHLNQLAQFIRYYDEVLTQSARNYAFTKGDKWKERYMDVEPKLDKAIKEAIMLGGDVDVDFFRSVDESNAVLVEMEYKAMQFVDNGQPEEAIGILEGEEYWKQKLFYERGLRDYVAHRGQNYDEVLTISTERVDTASQNARDLIKSNTRIILVLIGLGLILIVFLSISVMGQVKIVNKKRGKSRYGSKVRE